ncbi:MAG: hypothetical protein IJV38_08130 [Prevotella sp.]|nr:hypothetical protein [Prevotella sp.]
MAESDNLYIGWELRGKLEQQIKDAIKDAEKLQEAIEQVQAAGEKIDASKGQKHIEKNAREATEAIFKMTEVLEKANQAIARNTAHRNEDLWGFDDARLQRSVARLGEIVEKVTNIGAEAALSGNAVKNLLATLDANLVMKDVKSGTKTLVGQMDKEEKEQAKAKKEAAKEAAKAEKDAEDAAARNAAAQEKVKDALARIATARSQLSAVSANASQQEQMHIQLLLSLLDRLSKKLATLKGTDLSAKGALAGVLGSGYAGLMRNVSTAINDLQSGRLNGLGMSDEEWEKSKALAAQAQRRKEITEAVNEQAAAEARVEAFIQLRQHKKQMEEAREEREMAAAVREVNRALEEKAAKEAKAIQVTRENAQANQGLASAYERAAEMGNRQNKIVTQLQQQVAGYFGLYAGEHFLKNLIQIGGEFEVQHIALQNILGDVQQANSMFEQMKELAVVSPFNFRQLASYAKQVAAFNVPYNEMFDTTKRLADISAGLGVDMGRLILAYGQVRSASVLRGQELRQFTEAGIPLVQALANEFTRLNGRAVSTAEVFDLISKRAVPFEMVKKILWDMTNEGGRFFDTQFVLADTLAGKWSNLQDAWEIMLSNLADGEGTGGKALKTFVSLTTSLIENMNTLFPLISGMAFAYGSIKFKNWASSFGDIGFRGIDANIQKAQQLRAIELTRQKINGEITGHQYAQLMRMNAQKGNYYQVLAMEGKMNALQIQRVYQQGNLNKKQLEYLVLMGRITAEQRKQIIAGSLQTNAMTNALTNLKGFGSKLWAMTGWTGVAMIGIEAIIGGLIAWEGHLDEIARKNKDLTDSFSNRGKELSDVISGMTGTPTSNDEYKSAIDGMKEMLKQHSTNYGAIIRETEALNGLESQYNHLKNVLHEEKQITEEAENKATDFGSAVRDIFESAKNNARTFTSKRLGLWDTIMGGGTAVGRNLDKDIQELHDKILEAIPNVGKSERANELYRKLRNSLEEELGFGSKEKMLVNIKLNELFHIDNIEDATTLVVDKFGEMLAQAEPKIANKIRYGQKLNQAEKDKVQELVNDAVEKTKEKYPYYEDTLQGLLNDSNFVANIQLAFSTSGTNVNDLQKLAYGNMPEYLDEKIKNIATRWAASGSSFDAQNAAKKDLDASKNEKISRQKQAEIAKKNLESAKKRKASNDEIRKLEVLDSIANQRLINITNQHNNEKTAALYGIGYDYEGEKKKSNKEPKSGSKSDEQLKRWKEEWSELKAFYAEFKKWAQEIGSDAALKKLRETGLWGQFFNADGSTVYDMGDWNKAIGDFRKKLSGGSTERTKFLFDVSKEQLTPQYDEMKKAAEAILSQLDAALKEQGKKWNLYKKVLEATGNKGQAAQIAFGGQVDFSNQAEQLRSEIGKALAGNSKAQGLTVDELLGMNDEALRKVDIFKENTDGVYQRLMALKEAEQQVKAEDVELFLDALKNAKSLETELEQIRLKYDRTRNAIRKNGGSPTLLANADRNEAKEIADKRWEYFKKDEDWGRIFGNLDKMSTRTLRNMRNNLNATLSSITASEEATKALYEALAKIDSVVTQRNPFKAIGEALGKRNRLSSYSKQASGGDLIANSELSKLLGVQLGSKVTKRQIDDGIKGAEDDFVKGLDGISEKFKAVQDVLQPVIDLFDQLGMTEASELFQMGSNALGAASQVAGGLNALGLGAASPYGAAAAAGISIVSGIFALHDKALQEEIDASKERQKEMENLTKNLEKALERTLGGVYTTKASAGDIEKLREYKKKYDSQSFLQFVGFGGNGYVKSDTAKAISEALDSETYYDTKLAELYIQRDEIRKQMEAEQDKKNSDGGAIEDYKQQLVEMQDQIDNFALDMAKAIYDIDLKSWAKELSDAVVTAWEKGEDAVQAYTDAVKSRMKDLSKNILAQKVMEKAFENAKIDELIAKMMNTTNGKLDLSIVPQLATALGEAGETSVDAITAALDELERQGYIDKGDGSSSSSASKVIQGGFTEQETGLLLSYVNAIRADVSLNGARFDQLLSVVQSQREMPVIARAQLTELRAISANTLRNVGFVEQIYNLLHRVAPDGQSIKIK